MERLEYNRYGGPEQVKLSRFTLADPDAGDVVVRVAASSINPMDWKIRSGDMKWMTGFRFPRAMGTDFAGTVTAVGANVLRFKPGDAVVGTVSMKRGGAFAPMLVTSQDLVARKPPALSFPEAATLPIAGVTAWQVLVKTAQLRAGQRLFINGASGAVGQAAISLAHALGAMVVGRVGPRSVARTATLGLQSVLDYTRPIPPSLDGSFDLVFDANGSLSMREGDRLVKRGGKVVDIVPTGPKFLRALVSRSRKFVFADVRAEHVAEVLALAADRKLAIPTARTLSLAEAPAVLAALEQGQRLDGKAVITF
jgi:NADPH:quinone reductase-like Zn-dependent oxidoreductase